MKKTINIGSFTFAEYIGKRLMKDGIGYVPSSTWGEGSTDGKTFIKSVMPETEYDFLVYAHELGHCKADQKPPSSFVRFLGGVDESMLYNEFMAWDWALRYVRRLGFSVSKGDIEKCLKDSLGTYLKSCGDIATYANSLVDKFSKKWGLFIERVVSSYRDAKALLDGVRIHIDTRRTEWKDTIFFDEIVESMAKEKPINRKPWHDIVEAKNRQWHKTKKFI